MSKKKISVVLIGAGERGLYAYGPYLERHPDEVSVTAVAEPRTHFRNMAAKMFGIDPNNCFATWEELFEKNKLADAAIITTPDKLHKDPAIAAANKGYHILLEKPMATTAEDCAAIANAVKKNNVLMAVGHVLRYAPYYQKVKEIIDSKILGDVCCIEHLEGVGWWHQAHSYVRGNWRNTKESSFMLLAKSCHDMDLLRWWIGQKCLNVSSFGHLKHFRKENKPREATDRCLDCPLADNKCPYSAKRYYFDKLRAEDFGWPLTVLVHEFTEAALTEALRNGPYGRCVYACDNDVVDHQVVAMEFEDKITASFTMSAFTPGGRKTRILGSAGYLEGGSNVIRVKDFITQLWTEYDISALTSGSLALHGGGDEGLMRAFLKALTNADKKHIATGIDETLESHIIVFAAEKARNESCVVNMHKFYSEIGAAI